MVFLLSELMEKIGNNELDLLPQNYFDTDIYKASKELKKMQKLSSNILTTWYCVDNTSKIIELKSDN